MLFRSATMVTAGVYLIVRSNFVFDASSSARLLVVIIGAITLLFGALIGTAKDDIKKALAASTMSQIGYMILAAGLGPIGYAFAIMHLLTHGFFKAGMFLGAGSVMHGMNDEVNMRKYGGFIPGIRAGKPTSDYLQYVLSRITAPGSVYLAFVAIIPIIALVLFGASQNFPFGGTEIGRAHV